MSRFTPAEKRRAIQASNWACLRYRMRREAAKCMDIRPAVGGFPYDDPYYGGPEAFGFDPQSLKKAKG